MTSKYGHLPNNQVAKEATKESKAIKKAKKKEEAKKLKTVKIPNFPGKTQILIPIDADEQEHVDRFLEMNKHHSKYKV